MLRKAEWRWILSAAALRARPAWGQTELNVSNAAEFATAAAAIFAAPGADNVVHINGAFTMTQAVLPFQTQGGQSVTVVGNGHTSDGGGRSGRSSCSRAA